MNGTYAQHFFLMSLYLYSKILFSKLVPNDANEHYRHVKIHMNCENIFHIHASATTLLVYTLCNVSFANKKNEGTLCSGTCDEGKMLFSLKHFVVGVKTRFY